MQRIACLLAAISLCASAATAQTTTTRVIFLGANNSGADPAILSYLEGRYGKANVTYQNTEPPGSVSAATILGYDVAVLSSTPSSGRYRNILHNSPTPIVNMEEAMADDTPVGREFSITAGRTKETEVGHALTIKTAHPITKGFAVNSKVVITMANASAELWWSTGTQAPGAVSLATDDDTATNGFLTYVEVGATLLDNTRKASCRRVMFGMTDRSFNFFTAAGRQLFGQAVDWAADGCCAQRNGYGTGLAGKNGVPTLTADNNPVYGTTINIRGTNSSGTTNPGLLLIGPRRASTPALGGTVLVQSTIAFNLVVPSGGLNLRWVIPDLSTLCPILPRSFHLFHFQLLQLDRAAAQGVSFTRGLRLETGK